MVFQLVSRRYKRGTVIITSKKSFTEWGQTLGDDVLATAILDRMLHHRDVININGPQLPPERPPHPRRRRRGDQ
jgi:DNA replication protein DnaC